MLDYKQLAERLAGLAVRLERLDREWAEEMRRPEDERDELILAFFDDDRAVIVNSMRDLIATIQSEVK
jgi:hypothetical protein